MKIGKKIQKKDIDWGEYSKAAEWCNENNATIEDKGDFYEVVALPEPTQGDINAAEIERLKAELSATDYKCLKYVDGAISKKEYADVKAYRAELREKIKALRAE